MASTWQKMMYFLGLVDDEELDGPGDRTEPSDRTGVRPIESDEPVRPSRRAAAGQRPRSGARRALRDEAYGGPDDDHDDYAPAGRDDRDRDRRREREYEDDRYSSGGTRVEPYQPPQQIRGRRIEPPAMARRRVSANPAHAEAGILVQDDDRDYVPYGSIETEIVLAKVFSDAQQLADHLRAGRPVVLDLRSTEPEMVRRLVDFSSGLTYALDGSMRKIAQGVIMVSPPGVVISDEEKERLAELGLYARPDRP